MTRIMVAPRGKGSLGGGGRGMPKGCWGLALVVLILAALGTACWTSHDDDVTEGDGDADADGDGDADADGDTDGDTDGDGGVPDCTKGTYEGTYAISDPASLEGLAGYTGVSGSLTIWRSALTSLAGLECLQTIEFDLSIAYNQSLTSLHGLGALTSVGRLEIASNNALTNLDGLRGITSLVGRLWIHSNHSLTDLDGLRGLASVGSFVSIYGNDSLTDLAGLSGLTSVAGSMEMTMNGSLRNLDGLSGLTSVMGDLGIWGNDSLRSLSGLEALHSVGGRLGVGCYWFESGAPFPQSHWTCPGNSVLASLGGLAALTSVGAVAIGGNGVLPTCEAEALEAQLFDAGWEGEATIEGNDDAGVCE